MYQIKIFILSSNILYSLIYKFFDTRWGYFSFPEAKPSIETFYAAAAAAKLLQSCPTLCNPIDGSPLGSSVPGILKARILEWVAISFSNA